MTYLKRAVLKVLLDVGGEVLVLLQLLLHGDFILQLCNELLFH